MVSVCMATYNGSKYIKEQMDSILCQLSSDDELLVSDDGSTDNTLEIIKSYHDARIKIFEHRIDKTGFSNSELIGKNFEFLLTQAKGDYIYISDQDDIWMSNRLQIVNELLKDNDIVICNGVYFGDSKFEGNKLYRKNFKFHNYLLLKPTYFGCCTAFNSKLLTFILPFPVRMPIYDHWIGLIGEHYGKKFFYSEPLIYHRIHSNNASARSNFSLFYKIFYRLRFLAEYVRRIMKFERSRC